MENRGAQTGLERLGEWARRKPALRPFREAARPLIAALAAGVLLPRAEHDKSLADEIAEATLRSLREQARTASKGIE